MLLLFFENLLTAPPSLSVKLTAVTTIPDAVQLNSWNDLPRLLLIPQSLIPFRVLGP